jgi:trehalose utilization protein
MSRTTPKEDGFNAQNFHQLKGSPCCFRSRTQKEKQHLLVIQPGVV